MRSPSLSLASHVHHSLFISQDMSGENRDLDLLHALLHNSAPRLSGVSNAIINKRCHHVRLCLPLRVSIMHLTSKYAACALSAVLKRSSDRTLGA